jgi:hypothetical protein
MPYLADTNFLLRWQRPADPLYAVAQQAVRTLLRHDERLSVFTRYPAITVVRPQDI